MDLVNAAQDHALVRVSKRDLEIMRAVIRESSEALEDWEFATRMGCSREELRGLRDVVRKVESAISGSSEIE